MRSAHKSSVRVIRFLGSAVGLCCKSLQSGCVAPGGVLPLSFSQDALPLQGETGLGKGGLFLLSPPTGSRSQWEESEREINKVRC